MIDDTSGVLEWYILCTECLNFDFKLRFNVCTLFVDCFI